MSTEPRTALKIGQAGVVIQIMNSTPTDDWMQYVADFTINRVFSLENMYCAALNVRHKYMHENIMNEFFYQDSPNQSLFEPLIEPRPQYPIIVD
jgi:hypothetical protein